MADDRYRTVIIWNGYKYDNYYKACLIQIRRYEEGQITYCVKPLGHKSNVHEDMDGNTRETPTFDFSMMSIPEAVHAALSAARKMEQWEIDGLRDVKEALIQRIADQCERSGNNG